jgi:hypothetical protein
MRVPLNKRLWPRLYVLVLDAMDTYYSYNIIKVVWLFARHQKTPSVMQAGKPNPAAEVSRGHANPSNDNKYEEDKNSKAI